jgi:hypothetical protein
MPVEAVPVEAVDEFVCGEETLSLLGPHPSPTTVTDEIAIQCRREIERPETDSCFAMMFTRPILRVKSAIKKRERNLNADSTIVGCFWFAAKGVPEKNDTSKCEERVALASSRRQ